MDSEDLILGILIGLFLAVPITLYLTRNHTTIPIQQPKTIYENTEEWKIIRDKNGRTQGVEVIRKAKEA